MSTIKSSRNPDQTKQKILQAAITEFADKGLGGGRIDTIAQLSGANKRMIYYYYGDKDGLFTAVVEHVYMAFRQEEQSLELTELPPQSALQELVKFTWNYYLNNPEFLTIVNSQNLHKAIHLKQSSLVQNMHQQSLNMLETILEQGVDNGVFRQGINPRQLHITIAGICYYYLVNKYTQSYLLNDDLTSPQNLQDRLDFNIETIMHLVSVPQS